MRAPLSPRAQRRTQAGTTSPAVTLPRLPSLRAVPIMGLGQFARETSTRLSENEGAWPISVKAADEMLLTVPSLSWRQ